MKKGMLLSIGLLIIIFYINGCGINGQSEDTVARSQAGEFHAHDHQRGEGFGLWNQQRDKKNPVANIIARDERPARGMNGIADRKPTQMNKRISRFEAKQYEQHNSRGLSNNFQEMEDGNITKQISLQLIQIPDVRDARIISYNDRLLIAVDSEANNTNMLKKQITHLIKKDYPNKQVVVVTDRQAVDRIRLLDDGNRGGRERYGIKLREFFNEANEEVEHPFK